MNEIVTAQAPNPVITKAKPKSMRELSRGLAQRALAQAGANVDTSNASQNPQEDRKKIEKAVGAAGGPSDQGEQ